VYAPTRFEMSDAGRWVRARVIAVMLWAVFVVGFTVLPLAAVFFLVRFGGSVLGPIYCWAMDRPFLWWLPSERTLSAESSRGFGRGEQVRAFSSCSFC